MGPFDNPENVVHAINSLDAKIALAEKNDEKIKKYKTLFTTTLIKDSSYSIQNKYVLANIFIYLNEIDSAINLLETEIPKEENNGRNYIVVKLLVTLTQAYYQKGSLQKSIDTIEKALNLAEQERYVRLLIDGGSTIKELIQNILSANKTQSNESPAKIKYLSQ